MKSIAKKKNSLLNLIGYEIDNTFKVGVIATISLIVLSIGVTIYKFFSTNSALKHFVEQRFSKEGIEYNLFTSITNFFEMKELIFLGGIILLLVIFSFYIWLKEWFGNNRTIYTLLMLPVERWKLIVSKYIVCYFFFIINFGLIYLFKYIDRLILSNINYNIEASLIDKSIYFNFINDLDTIKLIFIFVTIAIIFVFNIVFINRLKPILGTILILIVELILAAIFFLSPIWLNLFTNQFIIVYCIETIIYFIGSFAVANYLLNKKIHV